MQNPFLAGFGGREKPPFLNGLAPKVRVSGVVLAREARNRQPDLKVLLMSGYADSHLEDHDLPRDVDFLGKPFKTSDLSAKVRAVIQA